MRNFSELSVIQHTSPLVTFEMEKGKPFQMFQTYSYLEVSGKVYKAFWNTSLSQVGSPAKVVAVFIVNPKK
jgi:hypothetical protein